MLIHYRSQDNTIRKSRNKDSKKGIGGDRKRKQTRETKSKQEKNEGHRYEGTPQKSITFTFFHSEPYSTYFSLI